MNTLVARIAPLVSCLVVTLAPALTGCAAATSTETPATAPHPMVGFAVHTRSHVERPGRYELAPLMAPRTLDRGRLRP